MKRRQYILYCLIPECQQPKVIIANIQKAQGYRKCRNLKTTRVQCNHVGREITLRKKKHYSNAWSFLLLLSDIKTRLEAKISAVVSPYIISEIESEM